MNLGLGSSCQTWVNRDKLHSSPVTRRMTPRSQSYCNDEMRSTPIEMLRSFQNITEITVISIYASWTKSIPSLEWPPSEIPTTKDRSFRSSFSQWIANREKLISIFRESIWLWLLSIRTNQCSISWFRCCVYPVHCTQVWGVIPFSPKQFTLEIFEPHLCSLTSVSDGACGYSWLISQCPTESEREEDCHRNVPCDSCQRPQQFHVLNNK